MNKIKIFAFTSLFILNLCFIGSGIVWIFENLSKQLLSDLILEFSLWLTLLFILNVMLVIWIEEA